jgi:hypothetical protein
MNRPPGDTCICRQPLVDSDIGEDGDDDFCWRCRRPVVTGDDEDDE